MRREARHLESESIALRGESDRLEKERLAFESATLEMEGKRDALESAIRRSEQERSRFEREKQLLEGERRALELEKEELTAKLDDYIEATARMHEQQEAMRREARHLENERIALRDESDRLEEERLALESATLEMKGERDALESATRRSEQERLVFERERQLLEEERHLLESERERWEKAREDRVPQGAFWETPPQPAPNCLSYGKREYSGALQNIPEDWTDLHACMNMPAEIRDVSVRRPDRCGYVANSPHIHGFWTVDWDQPDCKPWHQDFTDKVSLGPPHSSLAHQYQFQGLHEPGIRHPSYGGLGCRHQH